MAKICCYCEKKIKNEEEGWRIMHERCFDKYKSETKTPENYIFMIGKHKGKRFDAVKRDNPKYINWVLDQSPADDTPMAFLQNYCKKFMKDEHEKNKKAVAKDADEQSIYESSLDE